MTAPPNPPHAPPLVNSMGALPRHLVRGARVMVLHEESIGTAGVSPNAALGASIAAGASYEVGTLIRAPCGQSRALVLIDAGCSEGDKSSSAAPVVKSVLASQLIVVGGPGIAAPRVTSTQDSPAGAGLVPPLGLRLHVCVCVCACVYVCVRVCVRVCACVSCRVSELLIVLTIMFHLTHLPAASRTAGCIPLLTFCTVCVSPSYWSVVERVLGSPLRLHSLEVGGQRGGRHGPNSGAGAHGGPRPPSARVPDVESTLLAVQLRTAVLASLGTVLASPKAALQFLQAGLLQPLLALASSDTHAVSRCPGVWSSDGDGSDAGVGLAPSCCLLGTCVACTLWGDGDLCAGAMSPTIRRHPICLPQMRAGAPVLPRRPVCRLPAS